jgi:hypothetical protein
MSDTSSGGPRLAVLAVAVTALAAGSANVFLTRALLATPCPSDCAGGPYLAAPIYATLLAFIAMGLNLVVPCARLARARCARADGHVMSGALLGDDDELVAAADAREPLSVRGCASRYAQLVLPTVMDVFATVLSAASTLFVAASVGAATRGTMLLFAGAAGACGLGDALSRREWRGVAVSVTGTVLVGAAAVLDADAAASGGGGGGGGGALVGSLSPIAAAALGVGLSTLANLSQAVQVVVETVLLKAAVPLSPAEVNGVEGVLGSLVLLAALPCARLAGGEDVVATACCVARSPRAAILSVALIAAFAASTAAFMLLSSLRGAHFRVLLLVARSAVVWAVELLCGAAGSADGVAWGAHSFLAAAGYAVLGVGGALAWTAQDAKLRVRVVRTTAATLELN